MSGPGVKSMQGGSVDGPAPHCSWEGYSPTHWDDTPRVTTTIEMGGLTDCLSRVLVEDPQGQALEDPTLSASHEVSELDVGPHWHLYCLQLDVALSQDLSRPPPP